MECSLREVSRQPRLVGPAHGPKWRQVQTKVQTKVIGRACMTLVSIVCLIFS